jgi:site-specific DNA-methyltransferase (adenine-specific)
VAKKNLLYFGDNLHVLREYVKDESVDLVYLDPPFNSNASYNVLFKAPSGKRSQAQVQAFTDTWHWGQESEEAYDDVLRSGTAAAGILRALRSFLGENDMMAYLAMMAVRLIELHRVMKPTASLYLHCDPTASHYLKILLDGVFGANNFRNEIVWLRSKNPKGSQHASRKYSPHTDSLLYYSKTEHAPFYGEEIRLPLSPEELEAKYDRIDQKGRWADGPILRSASMGPRPNLVYEHNGFTPGPAGWRMNRRELEAVDAAGNLYWTSTGAPRRKFRPEDDRGDPVGNFWGDIAPVNSQAVERIGYPTQKPLSLLERVLKASSCSGDVVLDPFCGCGTALHAAQRLGRAWIGIDITHVAIQIIVDRLKRHFPTEKGPIVIGRPEDYDDARALAQRDKYQFQWWATSLVKGQPRGGHRKGADRGIDGEIFFKTGRKEDGRAIVSVKGGLNVNPGMVRDLVGTRKSEDAEMALLITLVEPSSEMITAAAKDGFIGEGKVRVPRTQILTIKQLLGGMTFRTPAAPVYDTAQAAAESRRTKAKVPRRPTAEELRREPELPPMTIAGGGRKKPVQPPLPLPDEIQSAPPARRPRAR